MPGRNGQRKPGTARGSPRRSRTAKASRISRHAAKSGRAREWGGWGRLSDDGPGQHNPDPSEDPWGGGLPNLHGGALTRNRPDTERDDRCCYVMREGRTQTKRLAAHAGSRLKPTSASGRPRLTGQPSSRTGENPPYGMIGGIEETSASFEARSAPRSYPTGARLPIEGRTRRRLQAAAKSRLLSVRSAPPRQIERMGSAVSRNRERHQAPPACHPDAPHTGDRTIIAVWRPERITRGETARFDGSPAKPIFIGIDVLTI